jgi:hypothetical protein
MHIHPHVISVGPGVASARHSQAFGKGLIGVLVNELASFVVQARDAAGNALHAGGDVVDVMLGSGMARMVDLRDQGNGTYHCALIAFEPCTLDVHVRLNGAQISGSPFAVRVLGYEMVPEAADEQEPMRAHSYDRAQLSPLRPSPGGGFAPTPLRALPVSPGGGERYSPVGQPTFW